MNGIEIKLGQFKLFLPYSVLIPSLKMGSDIPNQRLFRSSVTPGKSESLNSATRSATRMKHQEKSWHNEIDLPRMLRFNK